MRKSNNGLTQTGNCLEMEWASYGNELKLPYWPELLPVIPPVSLLPWSEHNYPVPAPHLFPPNTTKMSLGIFLETIMQYLRQNKKLNLRIVCCLPWQSNKNNYFLLLLA